jgi:hypothetical protein
LAVSFFLGDREILDAAEGKDVGDITVPFADGAACAQEWMTARLFCPGGRVGFFLCFVRRLLLRLLFKLHERLNERERMLGGNFAKSADDCLMFLRPDCVWHNRRRGLGVGRGSQDKSDSGKHKAHGFSSIELVDV